MAVRISVVFGMASRCGRGGPAWPPRPCRRDCWRTSGGSRDRPLRYRTQCSAHHQGALRGRPRPCRARLFAHNRAALVTALCAIGRNARRATRAATQGRPYAVTGDLLRRVQGDFARGAPVWARVKGIGLADGGNHLVRLAGASGLSYWSPESSGICASKRVTPFSSTPP